MNRRQFLLANSAAAVLRGQSGSQQSDSRQSFKKDLPDMLVNYFAQRFAEAAQRAANERSAVQSAAQAGQRNETVRARMRQMLGPVPGSPASVVQPVSVAKRQEFAIENLNLSGGAANLYLPNGTAEKFPAVLLQRGHFDRERMWPDYQQLHFDLVQNGIAVLSFDPVGNGGDISTTLEHFMLDSRLSLAGENLAARMVSDAMQALDYLASRPEIDASKLGCADYTDTGWTPAMLAALDDRVKCCVLHPHGSGKRWPLNTDQWNQLDDPEQFLPGAAKLGVDLIDILSAIAPRPLLTLVEDSAGEIDTTTAHLRQWYGLHNEAAHFSARTVAAGGDWPKQFRIESVRWFRRWLMGDNRAVTESAAPSTEAPRPLRSAPLAFHVSVPSVAPSSTLIREVIGIPSPASKLEAREFPPQRFSTYTFGRVELLTEPGIYVPGGLYRPTRSNGYVVIYTSADVTTYLPDVDDDLDSSKSADAPRETPAEVAQNLVSEGYTVLLVDLRGLGETAPRQVRRTLRGPWEHVRNNDAALGRLASQLGFSLVGMRVYDLMRAAEYAARWGKVILAGERMAALWAVYAGALDNKIAGVILKEGLVSYGSILEQERHRQATSQFAYGVLNHFDLPQVAALLAPRPLVISGLEDGLKNPVDPATAAAIYQPTRDAFSNYPKRLLLLPSESLITLISRFRTA